MNAAQPFDIVASSQELKNIDVEIKRLRDVSNVLKKRKTEIEQKIQKYLTETRNKGVVIHDMTILSEAKSTTKAIPKKEKEERIRSLLKNYTTLPEQLLQEIQEATKGTQVMKHKITIQQETKRK